jgi:hypothetical protein
VAGIINYYHGESGTVVDRGYAPDEEPRTYVLRLEGDPHRELAYDYGSDIAVDPLLRAGDGAVFVRLDSYAGIWVREKDRLYPELEQAVGRAMGERYGDHAEPRVTGETARKVGAGRVQRRRGMADRGPSGGPNDGSDFARLPTTSLTYVSVPLLLTVLIHEPPRSMDSRQ